jgi:hypothetical protein
VTEREQEGAAAESGGAELIAVEVGGQRIYLSARQAPSVQGVEHGAPAEDEEQEIAFRSPGQPRLEQLLNGLAGFAESIAGRLQGTDASKARVQFGCEVMVESGQFVAVIGKASSKAAITVELEWVKPTS